jgi:hypothetical protein
MEKLYIKKFTKSLNTCSKPQSHEDDPTLPYRYFRLKFWDKENSPILFLCMFALTLGVNLFIFAQFWSWVRACAGWHCSGVYRQQDQVG